jgi:hypothetical protein
MEIPKYLTILTQGEKALSDVLAKRRNNKTKKSCELEIAKIEEDIATKETSLLEAYSSRDLDFEHLVSLKDGIDIMNRKRDQYLELKDQLF